MVSSVASKGPNVSPAVVSGEHANVVANRCKKICHPLHGAQTHVAVQIAQVQDRKTVKIFRKLSGPYVVAPHLHAFGIPAAAPEQAGHLQSVFDDKRGEGRILDVEEVQPLPEYLSFVIPLHAEALMSMQASKTLLEKAQLDISNLKFVTLCAEHHPSLSITDFARSDMTLREPLGLTPAGSMI